MKSKKCLICKRNSSETEFPADTEAAVYRRLCNDCQIWFALAVAIFILAAGYNIGTLLM